jgi:hypothetical protein
LRGFFVARLAGLFFGFVLPLPIFISSWRFGGVLSIRDAICRVASSKSGFGAFVMPIVDLGTMPRDINLMIARIGAIESYAKVEQSLCGLFASLMGAPMDKAAIVFFRLTNTHSRNAIIEQLLKKAHGAEYDIYWYGIQKNGLLPLIRQLDSKRNEIVHWHGRTNIALAGEDSSFSESLVPPNFWGGSTASISAADLHEFIQKADFVYRSINMFNWVTTSHLAGADAARPTWLQIFAQPVTYPPENTHPLSQNYKGPESPPQSSEV